MRPNLSQPIPYDQLIDVPDSEQYEFAAHGQTEYNSEEIPAELYFWRPDRYLVVLPYRVPRALAYHDNNFWFNLSEHDYDEQIVRLTGFAWPRGENPLQVPQHPPLPPATAAQSSPTTRLAADQSTSESHWPAAQQHSPLPAQLSSLLPAQQQLPLPAPQYSPLPSQQYSPLPSAGQVQNHSPPAQSQINTWDARSLPPRIPYPPNFGTFPTREGNAYQPGLSPAANNNNHHAYGHEYTRTPTTPASHSVGFPTTGNNTFLASDQTNQAGNQSFGPAYNWGIPPYQGYQEDTMSSRRVRAGEDEDEEMISLPPPGPTTRSRGAGLSSVPAAAAGAFASAAAGGAAPAPSPSTSSSASRTPLPTSRARQHAAERASRSAAPSGSRPRAAARSSRAREPPASLAPPAPLAAVGGGLGGGPARLTFTSLPGNEGSIQCDACSKVLANRRSWAKHSLRCPSLGGEKRHACPEQGCPFRTNVPGDLPDHLGTAHGVYPPNAPELRTNAAYLARRSVSVLLAEVDMENRSLQLVMERADATLAALRGRAGPDALAQLAARRPALPREQYPARVPAAPRRVLANDLVARRLEAAEARAWEARVDALAELVAEGEAEE